MSDGTYYVIVMLYCFVIALSLAALGMIGHELWIIGF